jgi:hypothetical protein
LGILIGAAIGSTQQSDFPKDGPIDPSLIDGCLGFFGMLLGAGIGGIVGAISGSVLGASVATRSQKAHAAPSAQESSQTELARLKARIAELEGRRQDDDQPPDNPQVK